MDASKKDNETIPMVEDIDAYVEREIKPYNPYAVVDKNKVKVGYEIPFTRYFYKYSIPRKANEIADEIITKEKSLIDTLQKLFGEV